MSGPVVIAAERLGKRYRIGRPPRRLIDLVGGWRDAVGRLLGRPQDEFWALRDASFEVRHGEVVGVVGRNGAGKSTLLKVLSRITTPTEGRATVRGRVASLLEVGTGFHPDLTGRENVFLNGAILGMSRRDVQRRFDEIVAFAEVERFLDTQVKHYSTGMYMRLAFAVAAHLEPEVLIVDEVLSVGDAAFQKRCLGKLGEATGSGRTVLFVSHNMAAVESLCGRALLIDRGRIVQDGPPVEVVSKYLSADGAGVPERTWAADARPKNELFRLERVAVLDADEGRVTQAIPSDHAIDVQVDYTVLRDGTKCGCSVVLWRQDGACILSSLSNLDPEWHGRPRSCGVYRSTCRIPKNLLNTGTITVTVLVWAEGYLFAIHEDNVCQFEVHEGGGSRGDYFGQLSGAVRPLLDWKTRSVDALSDA